MNIVNHKYQQLQKWTDKEKIVKEKDRTQKDKENKNGSFTLSLYQSF